MSYKFSMSQKKISETAVSDYHFRSFGCPILGQTTDQTQVNTRLMDNFNAKQACHYYFDDPTLKVMGNNVSQRPIMADQVNTYTPVALPTTSSERKAPVDYYMNDPRYSTSQHGKQFVDRIVPTDTSVLY